MQKRNVSNSPHLNELKRKRHRTLKNKITVLFLLFLTILVGFVFLARWQKVNIINIQISGNKIIDTKMIEQIAKDKLTGYYLWVIPKTNFLLYPKKEIEKELTDKFKRLKDITLNIKDLKTLEINLSEREALYTWCGAMPPESTGDDKQKCFFVDKDGFIFDEAPYFSGEVYFKFYGDIEKNFTKLISFKETLEKMDLKPVALQVLENDDIKISLSMGGKRISYPEIIFKTDSNFQKLTENLQAALNTEPLQSNFKNKYSSLLYIDLRFGNKVYYKFR